MSSRARPLMLVVVAWLAGCGLVLDTDSTRRDAGVSSSDASSMLDARIQRDAGPRSDGSIDGAVVEGGLDAAVADAGTVDGRVADASPHDAVGGDDASRPDAGLPDGGALDARPTVDAGACGTLGGTCMGDGDCSSGETCAEGVCIPASRPICGGVVGDVCPSEYSDCPWCSGCDYGYCLTAAERACICTRAPGDFDCTTT